MKKLFVLFLVIGVGIPLALLAQALGNFEGVVPVVAEPSLPVPFNLPIFIQQILTNGGLVLLIFLCSKIPVVGPYLVKLLDVLVGNPKHK